jgi:hypothetical protein
MSEVWNTETYLLCTLQVNSELEVRWLLYG